MIKLGDQWVEVIDGKMHMLKAVERPEEISHISARVHPCFKCFFQMDDYDCSYPRATWKCDLAKNIIIKDLGVLNDDGFLPCPFCGEPSSGIASIRSIALVGILANFICKKCEAQITFCADTVEHCLDAWNRRA